MSGENGAAFDMEVYLTCYVFAPCNGQGMGIVRAMARYSKDWGRDVIEIKTGEGIRRFFNCEVDWHLSLDKAKQWARERVEERVKLFRDEIAMRDRYIRELQEIPLDTAIDWPDKL